jgi:hypothetical protein
VSVGIELCDLCFERKMNTSAHGYRLSMFSRVSKSPKKI